MEKSMEQTVKIEIDSSDLDNVLQKAGKLRMCLEEINQLIASVWVKVPEATKESKEERLSAYRKSPITVINQGPSVRNTDQIIEELSERLKEWTDHIIS